MKLCVIKPIIFLTLVAFSIAIFPKELDSLFGGHTKCFVCTKVGYNGYFTNWSISHFVVFAISGYLCPNNKFFLILIGTLWELFEIFLQYTSKTNNQGFLCKHLMPFCDKQQATPHEFWDHYIGIEDRKIKLFWCSGGMLGSIVDIIMDALGVYVGSYLAIQR